MLKDSIPIVLCLTTSEAITTSWSPRNTGAEAATTAHTISRFEIKEEVSSLLTARFFMVTFDLIFDGRSGPFLTLRTRKSFVEKGEKTVRFLEGHRLSPQPLCRRRSRIAARGVNSSLLSVMKDAAFSCNARGGFASSQTEPPLMQFDRLGSSQLGGARRMDWRNIGRALAESGSGS